MNSSFEHINIEIVNICHDLLPLITAQMRSAQLQSILFWWHLRSLFFFTHINWFYNTDIGNHNKVKPILY